MSLIIDVAGILQEKLELVLSDKATFVARALTTRRDRPRAMEHKKDLSRRSRKQHHGHGNYHILN